MDKFNESFEGHMLENVPRAVEDIKEKIGRNLDEIANANTYNNAISYRHSENNPNSMTNDDTSFNPNNMQSQTDTKAKTLVRERPNAPRVINNQQSVKPTSQQPNPSDQYRYTSSEVSSNDDNPFSSLREGGNTTVSTILIVFASFVIIAMLVMIYLTLVGNIGIFN